MAPWSRGAACLLHDGRFDPAERLELIAREGVTVLCQSPTEYRMMAKRHPSTKAPRQLRRLVSAGEPLNPEVIGGFGEAVGLEIHDGYGQTETGQLTGVPVGDGCARDRWGCPLPGFGLEVRDERGELAEEGELCVDTATVPTFFGGYLGEPPFDGACWRTGDRVRRDEDGFLWFEGRLDDVILSAGYRIGPFEVESALVGHPAVLRPPPFLLRTRPRRGRPRDRRVAGRLRGAMRGWRRSCRSTSKAEHRPYKYPRIVEFRDSLPKTASGKIKRAELRGELPNPE